MRETHKEKTFYTHVDIEIQGEEGLEAFHAHLFNIVNAYFYPYKYIYMQIRDS
jgi:hypothetical protein